MSPWQNILFLCINKVLCYRLTCFIYMLLHFTMENIKKDVRKFTDIYYTLANNVIIVYLGVNSCGCRTRRPWSLRCRSVVAHLLGLRVRIPTEAWLSISRDCCGLSDCLWDGPITRPLGSYGVCFSVSVITCNNYPQYLQLGGQTNKERKEI